MISDNYDNFDKTMEKNKEPLVEDVPEDHVISMDHSDDLESNKDEYMLPNDEKTNEKQDEVDEDDLEDDMEDQYEDEDDDIDIEGKRIFGFFFC